MGEGGQSLLQIRTLIINITWAQIFFYKFYLCETIISYVILKSLVICLLNLKIASIYFIQTFNLL